MNNKFLLSDTESELLLEFETSPGLDALSSKLGRDTTVISRQLKRISEKVDVLTKVSGRWCITEKGKRFNQATLDFLRTQSGILSEKYHLRVGTNREFASRCLSPNILSMQKCFQNASLEIRAYEKGTEQALLSGEIDIAFDCGRPHSPEIKYSQVQKEAIIAVASLSFIKKYGKIKKPSELLLLPHIYCERLRPDVVINMSWDSRNVVVHTNDIASARAMAMQGVGWALLPEYAIANELNDKKLRPIFDQKFDQEKYGVWHLRTRKHLEQEFKNACEWLANLKL